jgi:hypothetical protein
VRLATDDYLAQIDPLTPLLTENYLDTSDPNAYSSAANLYMNAYLPYAEAHHVEFRFSEDGFAKKLATRFPRAVKRLDPNNSKKQTRVFVGVKAGQPHV